MGKIQMKNYLLLQNKTYLHKYIYGFVGKYEQELPQTLRKTIQFCCFQIDFI